MYLASLNLDLFFKKVFSNKRIAKSFLQDLFGSIITEITILSTEHRISDDAVIVKFDFRCKINGKYVQIEMQQKYKHDVNKRFYLYHCVNTALQLESLAATVVTKPNGETYTEKDYSGIEPVITIVWMVDDSLNFQEDIVAFSTLPEDAKDFITDATLWQQPLEAIEVEREKVLKILNNTTKDLDFFAQNRLIYVFQGNIVRNKKNSSYFKWFDFAQKSRNRDNVEEDFSQFKKDKIMAEVMNRLKKSKLPIPEFKYVSDMFYFESMLEQKEKEVQEKEKEVQEKEKEVQAEHKKLLKAINGFLMLGKDIPYIADILDLSIDEVTALVAQKK
jgi:hypothetical protein